MSRRLKKLPKMNLGGFSQVVPDSNDEAQVQASELGA
jgi:hypothetical protein